MSTELTETTRHGTVRGIVVLAENRLLVERLKEELRSLRQRVLDHPYGDPRHYLFIVDDRHLLRLPSPCSKILLTMCLTSEAIDRAAASRCLGVITPGLDRLQLEATIRTALSVAETVQLLEKSNQRLLRKLRERKIIAMAKEVLQKRFCIGEEEAYQQIRMEATQSRKTLGEVASEILLRYE